MASELEKPDWTRSRNKRGASRNQVRIIADFLISAGPRFKVAVLDLSRTGFRIETGNYIPTGSAIYITLPGFQSLKARIAWSDRDCYGCEFANALHPSIFDHIAQKHPSLVQ
jgi:PilZ domain